MFIYVWGGSPIQSKFLFCTVTQERLNKVYVIIIIIILDYCK